MKIKLDENLPLRLSAALRKLATTHIQFSTKIWVVIQIAIYGMRHSEKQDF